MLIVESTQFVVGTTIIFYLKLSFSTKDYAMLWRTVIFLQLFSSAGCRIITILEAILFLAILNNSMYNQNVVVLCYFWSTESSDRDLRTGNDLTYVGACDKSRIPKELIAKGISANKNYNL